MYSIKTTMSQKSEPTIHDIARKLNLSASTVSRALKDNPLISEATRTRVRKTALEMGYRPNVLAASFRTKRTHTIGVVVPLINRHFFSSVISGIEKVAYNQGFTVSISQSNDNIEKEEKIAYTLFTNRVDGLIISIGMETKSYEHLKLFTERNIPVVFFDRIAEGVTAPAIIVDDYGGAFRAVSHLLAQGAKRIAHIGGPLNLNIYTERRKGFEDALKEAGIQPDEQLIIHNRLTRADGDRAVKELLKNPSRPDAVFCANDTTALSVIIGLQEAGLRVPEDVMVVGFSNEPFSEVVTPSISTVQQPGFDMGQKAAEIIIDEINGMGHKHSKATLTLPTELIIRNSSSRNSL